MAANPLTHLHTTADLEYGPTSAKCNGCGRTWRRWAAPKKYLDSDDCELEPEDIVGYQPTYIYYTEPKFPSTGRYDPRLKPKRD